MKHLRTMIQLAIVAGILSLAASCPQQSERVYPQALGGAPVAQAQETDPAKITVYVTKSGEKYHRVDCKYLAKSRSEISLKDAKAKGYQPCTICNPPR